MITHVSIRSYYLIGILALLLMTAQPTAVLSQVNEDQSTITGADVTDVPATFQYDVEQLIGDKVIGDFVLGPGKIELEIAPGESKTVMLTVSNRIGKLHFSTC